MKRQLWILVILFIISGNQLFASHYMGGEITWQCLANGRYRFIMILYRECYGIPYQNSMTINVTGNPSLSSITMNLLPGANPHDSDDGITDGKTDISPNCYDPTLEINCLPNPTSPNLGAVEEWYYTSDAYYPTGVLLTGVPPATGWIFSNAECCRNTSTNILYPISTQYFLRAVMYAYNGNNSFPCYDNSPAFAEAPSTVFTSSLPSIYNCYTKDADHDSLSYDWSPAMEYISAPVTYANGYSYNSPLPGISQNSSNVPAILNPNTGEISFTSFTNGAFVTTTKISEYRCGVLIGEVFREMQMVVIALSNPTRPEISAPFYNPTTGLYGFIDTVYAGETVDFDLIITDNGILPNSNPVTLILEAIGSDFGAGFSDTNSGCDNPPCATLNPPPVLTSPTTVSTHFHWQTSCSSILNNCSLQKYYHDFLIKATNNYCPVPGMNMAFVRILVIPPRLDPPQLINAELLSNGDATLTWIPPLDSQNFFDSYQVYFSNNINGPFTKIDSIFNYALTSKTYSGLGAASVPKYFYMTTRANCHFTESATSDTLGAVLHDAGISQIMLPENQVYAGNNLPVKVELKNYGQDTITTVNLAYSINGILQPQETWAGTLYHNQTAAYTFLQTFVASSSGAFDFCASTYYTGDMNNANDGLCKTTNSIIQYDAGVAGFVLPDSSMIEGNNQTVKIILKNFGNDTLTSVNLTYSVNGIILSTETWTGLLLPDDTSTFTFSQNFIVPAGLFEICATPSFMPYSNIANDTLCDNFYGLFTSNLPYYDNFDGTTTSWYNLPADSIKWMLGIPNHTLINNAHSEPDAWYIKSANSESPLTVYLYTQNFNFSTVVDAKMKFFINYFIPNDQNGVRFEYSINSGMIWSTLGIMSDTNGINWYNDNSLATSGLPAWTSNSTAQWKQCVYKLNLLNNSPSVRFRFVYNCSSNWNTNEIFAIDDISIYVPTNNDAGVNLINSPVDQVVAGTNQVISVNIHNFGMEPLTSIPISYRVGNAPQVDELWTGFIPEDVTLPYEFANTFVIPSGNFSLCAFTGLSNDENNLNDSTCIALTGIVGIDNYNFGKFELMQNAPNPSNNKTTIVYSVPANDKVVFRIENMVGQVIFTEERKATLGKNEIDVDISNIPDGIYFYSIEFQKQKLIKRLVINR
jgi:hypothetical protein